MRLLRGRAREKRRKENEKLSAVNRCSVVSSVFHVSVMIRGTEALKLYGEGVEHAIGDQATVTIMCITRRGIWLSGY